MTLTLYDTDCIACSSRAGLCTAAPRNEGPPCRPGPPGGPRTAHTAQAPYSGTAHRTAGGHSTHRRRASLTVAGSKRGPGRHPAQAVSGGALAALSRHAVDPRDPAPAAIRGCAAQLSGAGSAWRRACCRAAHPRRVEQRAMAVGRQPPPAHLCRCGHVRASAAQPQPLDFVQRSARQLKQKQRL